MTKPMKLIKEINKKRKNWDERSQFKFGDIGNLSVSDLDSIEFYATTYIKSGSINKLLEPRGAKSEVLAMYGIEKIGSSW